MEPKDSNEPNKKLDNWFRSISFSFQAAPVHSFNFFQKQETAEEMIARLDEVDETVDAMTVYPQAKKMLDKLYGKL